MQGPQGPGELRPLRYPLPFIGVRGASREFESVQGHRERHNSRDTKSSELVETLPNVPPSPCEAAYSPPSKFLSKDYPRFPIFSKASTRARAGLPKLTVAFQ